MVHGLIHSRRRNLPNAFEGRSSRVYDFMSRRVLRRMYRESRAEPLVHVTGVPGDTSRSDGGVDTAGQAVCKKQQRGVRNRRSAV